MNQDFKKLLDDYNKKMNDASKKITININEISTFDFIKDSDFFEHNPIMYDEQIWWRWDNDIKRWYIVRDVRVMLDFSNNFILQGANTSVFHSNLRTAILNALKQSGFIFKTYFIKDIKPTWVVFKDCIVDVMTEEVMDHNFTYFSKNSIPYNYLEADDTDTSKFDELFKAWVVGNGQDETWIETLYEVVAYSMLPDYPLENIFCLLGEGSNGKSSFIRLLVNFLGMYNIGATELSLLSNPNSRFETTALQGKLVCLMSELDDAQLKNTSLIKKLAGNKEVIRAEYKGRGHVEFTNYAKIIMSTNFLPDSADKTDGFYRRWLVIDFPNQFPETNGDVLAHLTEKDYSALARKCITILKNLLQKNTFTNLGSIKQRRQRYEDKANPLKRFIDEKCVVSPNKEIPVFELFEVVSSWLNEKGYRALSKPKLSRLMKENGFEVEPKHNPEVNKTWRYYIGIGLKDDLYPTVKVYDKEENQFKEIKEFRNIEYGTVYTWSQVCSIFSSYSEDELTQIIKDWKKQGAVTEVRSGIFRFENINQKEMI